MTTRHPRDDDFGFGPSRKSAPQDFRVLASAEFSIDLNHEFFEDSINKYNPERIIWEHRAQLRRRLGRQVQERLVLLPYGRHVFFLINFDLGSILVTASFLLTGMTIFEMISKYPDFHEGVNLLVRQFRDILFEETDWSFSSCSRNFPKPAGSLGSSGLIPI